MAVVCQKYMLSSISIKYNIFAFSVQNKDVLITYFEGNLMVKRVRVSLELDCVTYQKASHPISASQLPFPKMSWN